eukprot:ctg_381.g135
MAAARRGHLGIVRLLLEHGAAASVEARNHRGATAVIEAALCPAPSAGAVVHLLVEEAGAAVSARDAAGWTALHAAAWSGNVGAAREFIRCASAVAVDDDDDDGNEHEQEGSAVEVPLRLALLREHYAVARVLLLAGAQWARAGADDLLSAEQAVQRLAASATIAPNGATPEEDLMRGAVPAAGAAAGVRGGVSLGRSQRPVRVGGDPAGAGRGRRHPIGDQHRVDGVGGGRRRRSSGCGAARAGGASPAESLRFHGGGHGVCESGVAPAGHDGVVGGGRRRTRSDRGGDGGQRCGQLHSALRGVARRPEETPRGRGRERRTLLATSDAAARRGHRCRHLHRGTGAGDNAIPHRQRRLRPPAKDRGRHRFLVAATAAAQPWHLPGVPGGVHRRRTDAADAGRRLRPLAVRPLQPARGGVSAVSWQVVSPRRAQRRAGHVGHRLVHGAPALNPFGCLQLGASFAAHVQIAAPHASEPRRQVIRFGRPAAVAHVRHRAVLVALFQLSQCGRELVPGDAQLLAADEERLVAVNDVQQQPLVRIRDIGRLLPGGAVEEVQPRLFQTRGQSGRLAHDAQVDGLVRLHPHHQLVGRQRARQSKDAPGHVLEGDAHLRQPLVQCLAGLDQDRHAVPAPVADVDATGGKCGRLAVGGHARLVQIPQILTDDEIGRLQHVHRTQHLHLFQVDVVGVQRCGRLHGEQCQHLQQVILHDVADDTKVVKVAGAPLDAKVLLESDLDGGNVLIVPQRLQEVIGKPQRQHVLYQLLAQVVVDAEGLLLADVLRQVGVQFGERGTVAAERLFDHHPTPATVATSTGPRLGDATGGVQKHRRRHRQVVEAVGNLTATPPLALALLHDEPIETAERVRVVILSGDVKAALEEELRLAGALRPLDDATRQAALNGVAERLGGESENSAGRVFLRARSPDAPTTTTVSASRRAASRRRVIDSKSEWSVGSGGAAADAPLVSTVAVSTGVATVSGCANGVGVVGVSTGGRDGVARGDGAGDSAGLGVGRREVHRWSGRVRGRRHCTAREETVRRADSPHGTMKPIFGSVKQKWKALHWIYRMARRLSSHSATPDDTSSLSFHDPAIHLAHNGHRLSVWVSRGTARGARPIDSLIMEANRRK